MTPREERITAFFKKWEGGYVNHPLDPGGCTNIGVTIDTYQSFFGLDKTCEDLRNITPEEWFRIFRIGYYDRARCGEIENDNIALLICDWCWMSGVKTAVKKIQHALGLKADGVVGPLTLGALNAPGEEHLIFDTLWAERQKHFYNLVAKKPSQRVFLKGWLNRLGDIQFRD